MTLERRARENSIISGSGPAAARDILAKNSDCEVYLELKQELGGSSLKLDASEERGSNSNNKQEATKSSSRKFKPAEPEVRKASSKERRRQVNEWRRFRGLEYGRRNLSASHSNQPKEFAPKMETLQKSLKHFTRNQQQVSSNQRERCRAGSKSSRLETENVGEFGPADCPAAAKEPTCQESDAWCKQTEACDEGRCFATSKPAPKHSKQAGHVGKANNKLNKNYDQRELIAFSGGPRRGVYSEIAAGSGGEDESRRDDLFGDFSSSGGEENFGSGNQKEANQKELSDHTMGLFELAQMHASEWKPPASPEQVFACATAAITAHFADPPTTTGSPRGYTKTTTTTTTTTYHRKRSFFNYPSLSNQSTTTTAGFPSSSYSTDAFDLGFESGKVPLTTSRRFGRGGNNNNGKPTLHQTSQLEKRENQSALAASIEHLRLMVERNLVATLIGVYTLISLIIIIVLILPYLFNFDPNLQTRTSLDESTRDANFRLTTSEEITSKQVNNLFDVSSASRAEILELLNKTREISTQTDLSGPVDSVSRVLSKALGVEKENQDQANLLPADNSKKAPTIDGAETKHLNRKRVTRLNQIVPEPAGSKQLRVYRQSCQPLKVPFCNKEQPSGVFYDKTMLPNRFGQNRQSQVEKALGKYEPVLDIKCYPLMPLFLCSIYAPKCVQLSPSQLEELEARNGTVLVNSGDFLGTGSAGMALDEFVNTSDEYFNNSEQFGESKAAKVQQKQPPPQEPAGRPKLISPVKVHQLQQQKQLPATQNHWSILVPPCRSLCKEAMKKCTFFFEVLSLKLASLIDCEQLPESEDPNVCIGQAEMKALAKARESQHCAEDKFRCSNGECIPKKWRCDSFPDCTDKSDEEKCSLCRVDSEFYCGNNTCIEKRLVCNGIKNCRDGRDERQCLRLAASSLEQQPITREGSAGKRVEKVIGLKRKLEVWSALNDNWIPVCGSYWMPMAMSHAVCQVLGFSRAKETLILFGDSNSNSNNNNTLARPLPAGGRKRKRHAGWFDVAGLLGRPKAEPVGEELQQQLEGVVQDVASQASSMALIKSRPVATSGLRQNVPNKSQRANESPPQAREPPQNDHKIEFASLDESYTSAQLEAVQTADFKHPSLTSMLIHGPQAGCEDKSVSLSSNVYIECENFQCGRPVTSFITRVREEEKLQQASSSFRSGLLPTIHSSSLSQKSPSSKQANQTTGKRTALLEATEEIGGDEPEELAEEEELVEAEPEVEQAPDSLVSSLQNPFGLHSRIVGGIESLPGEFPYLAALHGGPDEIFFCGGVLISINWLLTASHCVGNRTKPDGWMVKVGVTRRVASPTSVRKLSVRKIIKHPQFNQNITFNNDIALILLEEVIEFNQYLRPICLPSANLRLKPENSKDCVVVGFGKSKYSQEAEYLQVAHFVNVPIVRHSTCLSWYAEQQVNLTEGMLCAGYAEGKRDACQGDSGSGLFCRNANTNQFFIAGVVSFGIKCATPKLPGVYTSVPAYVDWIEATTRENGYPIT